MILTGSVLLVLLSGGFTSGSPSMTADKDTAGFPGPVPIKPGCPMRGFYDSREFDDTYRLNMADPPDYLKEYYANFQDRPDGCDRYCNYSQVMAALKLTEEKEKLTMSRPVENFQTLTLVYLEMTVPAILSVKENEQLFIARIWLYMAWHNKFLSWKPEEFCGLQYLVVPSDSLWKPDVIIEEMTEKDKTPPSPFIRLTWSGEAELRTDQVVSAACSINVYKFPFDIQRCSVSFKSLMHSDQELQFIFNSNTTVVSRWARQALQSQHEWIFIKMTVASKTNSFYFGSNQTAVVYTVFMQRRATLHSANFLLPIFFFLCLDVASWLIPDGNGEKITFRITVLLAVTVLQLLLHDILPCSSDQLPLISLYCLGVLFLMLLSLLQAILVRHLVYKESLALERRTERDRRNLEKKHAFCVFCKDWKNSRRSLTCQTSSDKTSETKEKSSAVELEENDSVPSKEPEEPVEPEERGSWTQRVETINRGFFIVYLTTAIVFLVYMFSLWTAPDED